MALGLLTSLALGAAGLIGAGAIAANSSVGSVYYSSYDDDDDEDWDENGEEPTEVATSISGISKHVY